MGFTLSLITRCRMSLTVGHTSTVAVDHRDTHRTGHRAFQPNSPSRSRTTRRSCIDQPVPGDVFRARAAATGCSGRTGGAGKSTFARELSDAAGGAPVVHTDDFALCRQPDRLVAAAPRTIRRAVGSRCRSALRRYVAVGDVGGMAHDRAGADRHHRGRSAGRSQWAADLSFVIWIETPT